MAESMEQKKDGIGAFGSISIAALRNGFLLHTPWGKFAYLEVDKLLKDLKPQLQKFLESHNHFHENKVEGK